MILGDQITLAVPSGWWRGGNLQVSRSTIERYVGQQAGGSVRLQSLPGQPAISWAGLPDPGSFTATYVRSGSFTPAAPPIPGPTFAQRLFGTGTPDVPGTRAGASIARGWESLFGPVGAPGGARPLGGIFGNLFKDVKSTALVVGGVLLVAYVLRGR